MTKKSKKVPIPKTEDEVNKVTLQMQKDLHQLIQQFAITFRDNGISPQTGVPAIMSMLGAAAAHTSYFSRPREYSMQRTQDMLAEVVEGFRMMLELVHGEEPRSKVLTKENRNARANPRSNDN